MTQDCNFKCPKTGKEFYFQKHSMAIKSDGSRVYKDHYGKELINPDNGEVLIPIEKEFKGYCTAIHGSKGQQQQKMVNHLKSRSHKDYKKNIAPKVGKQVREEAKRRGNNLKK